MCLLDGRAVASVIAVAQRPEPVPLEDSLKLDSQADGSGSTAEGLREQPGAASNDATPLESASPADRGLQHPRLL